MKRIQKVSLGVVAGGVALALAACGGGGGSTTTASIPTTPLAITVANSETVAAATLGAIGSMNSFATNFGTSVPQSVPSAGVMAVSSEPRRSNLLSNAAKTVTKVLTATGGTNQAMAGGVVLENNETTTSFDCKDYGSWKRTLYDMNSNGSFYNVGDGMQATFYGCVEPGAPVQDGTMAVFLGNYSGIDYSVPTFTPPWSAEYTVSFTDYKQTNSSTSYSLWNGSVNLGVSEDSGGTGAMMMGTELTETYLEGSALYADRWEDFVFTRSESLDGVAVSEGFTLASSRLGGVVLVKTLSLIKFAANADYPYSGELTITGANSGLHIIFLSDASGYTLWVDTDGDGKYETGPTTITW